MKYFIWYDLQSKDQICYNHLNTGWQEMLLIQQACANKYHILFARKSKTPIGTYKLNLLTL